MPKKIFAVTNIKIGSGPGEFFPAGTEIVIDPQKFDKATLLNLHAEGAIEIRVVDESEKANETPETTISAATSTETPEVKAEEQ